MAKYQSRALDDLSRRTGIPKYQHHVAVSANGRMFFPAKLLERWKITEEDAFLLGEVEEDRCRIILRRDVERTLPYHLHSAPRRNTPCIVVLRALVTQMKKRQYDFPRRMRFSSPPLRVGEEGDRELWLEFRRVRDLYAIGVEQRWVRSSVSESGKI